MAQRSGLQDDDLVDESVLGAWVSQVLDSLKTADRAEVGELQIGHMLHRRLRIRRALAVSRRAKLLEKLQTSELKMLFGRKSTTGVASQCAIPSWWRPGGTLLRSTDDAAELADRWPRTQQSSVLG